MHVPLSPPAPNPGLISPHFLKKIHPKKPAVEETTRPTFIVPHPQGYHCMCTSHPCPNDCRTVLHTGTQQQYISRTYIRVYDEKHKTALHSRQMVVPGLPCVHGYCAVTEKLITLRSVPNGSIPLFCTIPAGSSIMWTCARRKGGRGVNEEGGILLILILLIHNRTEDYYLGKETGEYPEMIQPYLRVFVI